MSKAEFSLYTAAWFHKALGWSLLASWQQVTCISNTQLHIMPFGWCFRTQKGCTHLLAKVCNALASTIWKTYWCVVVPWRSNICYCTPVPWGQHDFVFDKGVFIHQSINISPSDVTANLGSGKESIPLIIQMKGSGLEREAQGFIKRSLNLAPWLSPV